MIIMLLAVNLACVAFGAYWIHAGNDIPLGDDDPFVDGTVQSTTLGVGILLIGLLGACAIVAYFWVRSKVYLHFQYWIPLLVVIPFAVFTGKVRVVFLFNSDLNATRVSHASTGVHRG